MSIAWKEMVAGATLTGVSTTFYTAPALTAATIQAATAYNSTGAPITLSIYKVPVGKGADITTLICTRSVPAGTTVQANETLNHKLQAGTQIFAVGNGLTLNISGVEYIPE